MTYSAAIRVPRGLRALMSADHESAEGSEAFPAEEGLVEYRFRLDKPIPSYLVALAVGDLVSAPIGPRSAVWTEPSQLDAAHKEFEGVTEDFIRYIYNSSSKPPIPISK